LAVITNQLARLGNVVANDWLVFGLSIFEAAIAFGLGRVSGMWWLAAVIVAAIELRALWFDARAKSDKRVGVIWEQLPGLIMGLSVILIIALVPRAITQVVVGLLYAVWLVWRRRVPAEFSKSLVQLLIIQGTMFEAIFLMAATPTWPVPVWLTLAMVWAGSYVGVYATLKRRDDRSAGVMAATWGVIATEVAWVLMLWLITYTMRGGYVLVPQPALILTALSYVFGSVLASSRQGNLSRARLAEYMLIALVLVVIVVIGTSWRGNV